MMIDQSVLDLWKQLRQEVPLVFNITNVVSINFVANVLLALGASPVMSYAQAELIDLVKKSRALVLNIGTLDDTVVAAMSTSLEAAKKYGIPVVLDPVGVHATDYRLNAAKSLLKQGGVAAIRGNASEIMALAQGHLTGQGVDSIYLDSDRIKIAADILIKNYQLGVVVTGLQDHIYYENKEIMIPGGDLLMTKITGMGCSASAVLGAFLGVTTDKFFGMHAAMTVMKAVGQFVGESVEGPGQFANLFLDVLYQGGVFDEGLA